MRTFALALLDIRGSDRFAAVRQFIAADASGSFGLLAGHEPMVAVLRYGLVRFELADGSWRYAALPGGTLRFIGNRLTVSTVHYFLDLQRATLIDQLTAELARTDSDTARARATLTEIEHALIWRLGELVGRTPRGAQP